MKPLKAQRLRFAVPGLGVLAAGLVVLGANGPTAGAQPRQEGRTPAPVCTQPDRDPRPIRPFDINRVAEVMSEPWADGVGEVEARVDVSADGAPQRVSIGQVEGTTLFRVRIETSLTREAMRMRFDPAIRQCRPVPGTYRLKLIMQVTQSSPPPPQPPLERSPQGRCSVADRPAQLEGGIARLGAILGDVALPANATSIEASISREGTVNWATVRGPWGNAAYGDVHRAEQALLGARFKAAVVDCTYVPGRVTLPLPR